MICPPCARAADADTAAVEDGLPPLGHDPQICRDAAIQPHGCGCAHQPVSTGHVEAEGAAP